MIRFRNPASSLETMLASFEELYNALKDKEFFDNDDIAVVLAKANLMASSGFTGDTALSLGANKNRSRDKTYNNAKMFAETYRLLGLISAVNNVSSNYRFTYIGEHMVVPGVNKKALIEQCILGMNNPNKILDVSYRESVRFFSCVLLTISQLGGIIHRDEMILGPMNVNDNLPNEFENMINYIKELRKTGNYSYLQDQLKCMANSMTSNKKEGMKVNSVINCTRFPISVLKFCNWVENEHYALYGKKMSFMKLTQHGCETVKQIKLLKDIRLSDYENSSEKQKKALIIMGTYQMLKRANFNTFPVEEDLKKAKKDLIDISDGKEILFSPYQTLEYNVVNNALGFNVTQKTDKNELKKLRKIPNAQDKFFSLKNHNVKINKEVGINEDLVTNNVLIFTERVRDLYKKELDANKVTTILVKEHSNDKKSEFYPLIETLFRIIGVDCHKSRDGVNGERWDAMIRDPKRSIPIEIKSPTEEMHISIKAIRQALENKIILLSRKTYTTDSSCSSYAVGYLPPNERAEVSELIRNIKETYNYTIAVFDIATLISICVNIIIFRKGIDIEKLYELEGIINVENITN